MLWYDEVATDPLPSTRRFLNTFFLDNETGVEDAVVAVRLPYERVNISGSTPFSFLSNDVVRESRGILNIQFAMGSYGA